MKWKPIEYSILYDAAYLLVNVVLIYESVDRILRSLEQLQDKNDIEYIVTNFLI